MFKFFWTRAASIWIAVLYIILGLLLLIFPTASGKLFVWVLAAGTAVYAVCHLVRYFQAQKQNQGTGGDIFLTILPLAFAIFAVVCPQVILSFLPFVLGALLLVDGVGKLPLVIASFKVKSEITMPLCISALIPLVLGIILLINPFSVAKIVIRVFGFALIADGVSDFVTAVTANKYGG